jgi:hypothetical protein
VVSGRNEHVGIDAAGERFGCRSVASMDAAPVVRAKENASAIWLMVQPIRRFREPASNSYEQWDTLELRFLSPALILDPLLLLRRNGYVVLPTT